PPRDSLLPRNSVRWHPGCGSPGGGGHSRLRRRAGSGMRFNPRSSIVLSVVGLTVGSVVVGAQQATVAPTAIAQQVRKHLMSLPYYGVFDLLTLNVADDG